MVEIEPAGKARVTADGPVDLLVIGGGINGAGIARDAAGRGLSVTLVEQDDLAGHTSSASTKLIHGGLRYLEHRKFRLVREALAERERLLRIAPHIIWPMRFVLPHDAGMRPAWLIGLGLFLYDHIGGRRSLPASEALVFDGSGLGSGLRRSIAEGFAYSDCWVEDSRLVVLNAVDAAERGAIIRTRTRLLSARRDGAVWTAQVEDRRTGRRETILATRLVNAAGPWVSEVLQDALGRNAPPRVRLVKGSHIVVPRLYPGEHAYLLQNPDKRVIFAIPYERDFTLIGTTDLAWEGDVGSVAITEAETDYLCAAVNRWLRQAVTPAQVVWSFAGVRPLQDDGTEAASEVTRDYVLDLDAPKGEPPCLSVFGGKITTYRKLAEHALQRLNIRGKSWTGAAALPGGDIPARGFELFVETLMAEKPFLPPVLARRLARAYGTRVHVFLADARSLGDLGEDLGAGLTEAELDHLVNREYAASAEDVLWRRSKLGLRAPAGMAERLARHPGITG
jgi:glycerol-3-phosphate dehydrogenase